MQSISTYLRLLNVLINLIEAWESSTKVDIIYVVFMTAIDTMPHEHLLYEISRY